MLDLDDQGDQLRGAISDQNVFHVSTYIIGNTTAQGSVFTIRIGRDRIYMGCQCLTQLG